MELYRMDFAMQRGHEMLLDREQGIVREQLDELELSMLQASEVPRLLRMDWYEMDGRITFRYALSGKRMLSQRLQTGPFTMRHYYQLMLAIVEALADCKHYMLRSEAVLLQEQYMYVGDSWQEVGLAYMPMREAASSSARQQLMGLAVRWTVHIEQVDGDGLQRMLRELGSDTTDWTPLRELLLELIALAPASEQIRQRAGAASAQPQPESAWQRTAVAPTQQPTERARQRAASVQPPERTPAAGASSVATATSQRSGLEHSTPQRQSTIAKPMSSAQPEQRSSAAASRTGLPQSTASAASDIRGTASSALPTDDSGLPAPEMLDDQPEESSGSRRPIVIGAIVVIAAALVWRYGYMETPTLQRALLCGGLTLLAAAAGYWAWRSANQAEEREDDTDAALQQEIDDYAQDQSAWRWGGWERQPEPAQDVPAQNAQSAPAVSDHPPAIRASGWAVPEEEQVAVLAPTGSPTTPGSEETVLLGTSGSMPGDNREGAYLERLWEGRSERVSLAGQRFVIGRSGEAAHYVDPSSGLSRSHLEILRETSGYAAKDLGSRNGTLLNGESMIPYKLYAIQPGDRLQLAGSHGAVYTFQAI